MTIDKSFDADKRNPFNPDYNQTRRDDEGEVALRKPDRWYQSSNGCDESVSTNGTDC